MQFLNNFIEHLITSNLFGSGPLSKLCDVGNKTIENSEKYKYTLMVLVTTDVSLSTILFNWPFQKFKRVNLCPFVLSIQRCYFYKNVRNNIEEIIFLLDCNFKTSQENNELNNKITLFLGIILRSLFYLKQRFGDWFLSPSSGINLHS
jgi:hypothetical protein